MDARFGFDPPPRNCPVAALSAAFEARLNSCCPTDLAPVELLMDRLAQEMPLRGPVRIFLQQWTMDRVRSQWPDFRVATIKLFRLLRVDAARDHGDSPFGQAEHHVMITF